MKTQNLKKYLLCVTIGVFLAGCSREMETAFQKNKADPEVKLFQVFDETPAIKSMFENIDQDEFNRRANDLQNSNPELIAQLYLNLANTFYGNNAALPKMVKSMAEGLDTFHAVYSQNPNSLDATFDVVDDILTLDPQVMMDGVGALTRVLTALRNWDDNNNNGIIDEGERPYSWDFFGNDQELADIGYDGINRLIENMDFVNELYDGAENLDDPAYLMRNFIQTVVDDNVNVEARVAEMIDFIENPKPGESIRDIEEDVADWMVGGIVPEKKVVLDYLINDLYPMIEEPVLSGVAVPDLGTLDLPGYIANEDDYRNFVKRGRWLLDEQAKLFGVTPVGLSQEPGRIQPPSADKTLMTQWMIDSFYNDVKKWDDLESVNIFDFDNNELLKWLGSDKADAFYSIGERLKASLKLGGDQGIERDTLQKLLWEGRKYIPTIGTATEFRGILKSVNPGNWTVNPNDGYTTIMAKTKSNDTRSNPFRVQASERLNVDGFSKTVNLNYQGESIIEAVLTNMQLHILQDYFSPAHNKWALTPEDGQDYFGDPNKNIQTLIGGITQSLRNVVMLDKKGREKEDTENPKLSALTELLYVMAAGYGVVDTVNAPSELSVKNCMISMGSPLGQHTYIESDVGLFSIQIEVIGRNDIYRQSAFGGGWVKYATQHNMPANELLQPGTFRKREGNTVPPKGSEEWHGRFAASQGDVIGITDESGRINTTNWNMAEIAIAGWEGYGPYTYRGAAPNGSSGKFKNDYYTDWYYIDEASFGSPEPHNGTRGPGCGEFDWGHGRYHMFESIYVPSEGEPGFMYSGFTRNGKKAAKYGYLRQKSNESRHFTGGNYNTPGTHFSVDSSDANDVLNHGNRVTINCTSREEAVRKNIDWLLHQKKYIYVIPIHAAKRVGWWIFSADIEIYAYNLIIANGVKGITKAKRYGNSISHNAIWGNGLSSNLHSGDNYYLNLVSEGGNTARLDGVSFDDGDYCVVLDYKYYITGLLSGIAEAMVDMTVEIWNSLGSGPVLPSLVGNNMEVMFTMARKTYDENMLMHDPASERTLNSMSKFDKYFSRYYPELVIAGLRDDQLPPVPKVRGVSYPTAFDANGNAINWEVWNGTDKGMFDDFMALLAMIVGTIHEDGQICADFSGNPATEAQIDEGNFAFFARDGFRSQLDNFVLTTVALNETKCDSGGVTPVYNLGAITNILVDHDAKSDSVIPGSREGVLPALLNSKYMNINYVDPIKASLEQAVRHVIRSYLNSFAMSLGPVGGADLDKYYLDEDRTVLNPDINWDLPINRLRYFSDNKSLDQLKRSLDMIRDLSQDARFVSFFKKSIPAVNAYLYIKWLDENWDGTGTPPTFADAEAAGMFYLDIDDADVDKIVDFLNDFEYANFIDFIQESGINDIEGLYNFSFDNWGAGITPAVLQRELGNLNENLVKYFGINLLESAVLGVYEIVSDPPAGFEAGDMIYGHGKYVAFDAAVDGDADGIVELEDDNEDGIVEGGEDFNMMGDRIVVSKGKHYRYVDVEAWVTANKDNAAKCTIKFPGLRKFIDFRHDDEDFSDTEYCMDYTSIWFRAGSEESPNVFNLHNYDLRMDWAMNEYNTTLISFTADDFLSGQPLEPYADSQGNPIPIGKNNAIVNRPSTVIDWLFGWNGSSYTGLNIQNEMNFAKNVAVDSVFDESTFTVPNPNDNLKTDYEASVRTIVQDYRTYLFDNLLEYEYAPGLTEEYKTVTSGQDLADGHRHALNNMTEALAELLSPVQRNNPAAANENYVTGSLFDSWVNFVDAADIEPENLRQVQDAVGNLLWDPDAINPNDGSVGYYTHLFSKMSEHAPGMMRQFQGMYGDLIQLGLLTFAEDGIGTYMMDVMKPAARYDSWDLVEEFNYLINTDIFTNYVDRDTFWWQAGNLVEDLAIILVRRQERGEEPEAMDYFGAVSSIFR